MPSKQNNPTWTFLSNHAHVLLLVARDPEIRMRDIAATVGITERAVQRIIDDLAREKYLTIQRDGRRNRYTIDPKKPLRHPIEAHRAIEALIQLLEP